MPYRRAIDSTRSSGPWGISICRAWYIGVIPVPPATITSFRLSNGYCALMLSMASVPLLWLAMPQ